MPSRQGKIALQLTQWVGGTIIALMGVFVVADYLTQARYLYSEQETAARLGAEGLKSYMQSEESLESLVEKLGTVKKFAEYSEGAEDGFAVFDLDGVALVATSRVMSNNQAEREALAAAPVGEVEIRRLKIGTSHAVAALAGYETRTEPPVAGRLAYVVFVDPENQVALKLWATRVVMVLVMIVGTMLAVRIPVRKFVVAPIDGLFMAAYAASKDDYRKMPPCTVDNEFAELYEMFSRLLGHLSDTRAGENATQGEGDLPDMGEEGKPLE